MKKTCIGILVAAWFLLLNVTTVSALPIISVDMDPGTLGIQSTLTMDPGDTFTIDVVFTGDGVSVFDTVILDVAFNDAGSPLALAAGPTAGTLAGTTPFTIDLFSGLFLPVLPTWPLTPDTIPVAPGYTGGIGGVGLASLFGPFPLVGAGATIDIFDLTFQAAAPGTTTISALGFPMGFELALAGVPIPTALASGSATVVPEPCTLFLMGTGLIGFVGSRIRKRFKK